MTVAERQHQASDYGFSNLSLHSFEPISDLVISYSLTHTKGDYLELAYALQYLSA